MAHQQIWPRNVRSARRKFARAKTVRLAVESLDDRNVPATFTVTTGADDGLGSFRQAILDSNSTSGKDTIAFNIGGGGVRTIQPTSALPEITDPVVVDGTTQPGYAGSPLIVLNGSGFNGGSGGYGLWITAGDSTVRGLVVNGFTGAEIRIEGGGNNLVVGSYVGTDVTGTIAVPGDPSASNIGLLVRSANNRVGGPSTNDRNLISGHNLFGVHILGPAATGNRIEGNFIGTDVTGTVALANVTGIFVDGSSSNFVGGTNSGAGNVVSGNASVGVAMSEGTDNRVQGNQIGTDVTGTRPLGNLTGVYVSGGSGHLIGGTEPGARNIISGNKGHAPTSGWGINITSGNFGPARNHQVVGNYVGTDVTGTAALPNNSDGIRVDFDSANVMIGGTSPGARNVVSGNREIGIYVTSGSGNIVQGNYVGTNAAGTAALPNGSGVIVGGRENTVGGTAPGAGNLLSGNVNYGLFLTGVLHVVQGNRIGTNAAGTAALPNTSAGLGVDRFGSNTIGGTAANAGNLISGNGGYGIYMVNSGFNTVQGNLIGTDVTGTRTLGNGEFGLSLQSGTNNLIGGAAAGAGNVIAGSGTGLEVLAIGTTVQGNHIGTDATGTIPLGNGIGVFLKFSDKALGGTGPGEGNTIAFNSGAGVVVDFGTGRRVRGNSIHSNGGLGIDLRGDGVTLNDAGDADDGPNHLQNFPRLTMAQPGASTRVTGTLNSSANTTFTLDFYASSTVDPTGFGEGARYLGSADVVTDAAGNASFDVTLAASTTAGEVVTATATDSAGNTSEFSAIPTRDVEIDIQPGDVANEIILGPDATVAVALLTTPDFDAATVDATDLSRIRFGDVTGTARVSPERESLADVDGDGDLDRVFVFSPQAIRQSGALTESSNEAELTGMTFDGMGFRGVDAVTVIVPPTEGMKIDIQPGDPDNVVSLGSGDDPAVAVLTTWDFDAATLDATDLSRIHFGDESATRRVSPERETLADVDGDGDLDRVFVFSARAIRRSGALTASSTEGELTGFTFGAVEFRAIDAVTVIVPPAEGMSIDIKPGNSTNQINLISDDSLAVAVLTTTDFDAADLDATDLSRIRFGDVAGSIRVSPERETLADVDGDGDLDRVFVFSVPKIRRSGALTPATTQAELTGATFEGESLRAADQVSVVHPVQVLPPGVEDDPSGPGGTVLIVEGTTGNDQLLVRPRAGSRTEFEVLFNGNRFGPFAPTGGIRVIGYAGNDRITVVNSVSRDVILDGGDGNDTLTGALGRDLITGRAGNDILNGRQGNDVLVGGTGADTLYGGPSRNVLIGGEGADRLVAGGGDLLVAGRTAFDLDPTALGAIRDEWTSGRGYRARVANLRGEVNPQFDSRLNGNYFLRTDGTEPTAFDDGARDVLVGGLGADWFLANRTGGVTDVLIGSLSSEIKDELV